MRLVQIRSWIALDVPFAIDVLSYVNPACKSTEEALNWNWKPLLAFSGPLSQVVSDDHMVFYRKCDDGFEYAGAICRWSW